MNPNSIDWYIDQARARAGIDSDRELSRFLGFKAHGSPVSHWRTRRCFPSDETMIELAKVAGADPERALAELNVWRAKDETTAAAYRAILSKVSKTAAAVIFFLCISAPVFSAPTVIGPGWSVYYGK